jgi:hypothetical protein
MDLRRPPDKPKAGLFGKCFCRVPGSHRQALHDMLKSMSNFGVYAYRRITWKDNKLQIVVKMGGRGNRWAACIWLIHLSLVDSLVSCIREQNFRISYNDTDPIPYYWPLSISTGAQYVTPHSKIYCEKVKMCRFSSGNWFFCTKFVQLAVAGKTHNSCASQKIV